MTVRSRPGSTGPAGGPSVDVVIVNWNGCRWLPGCLGALKRSTIPVRIIVVDCASEDGSVRYVREAHPDVELVVCPENLGYAGGANAGLARSTAPFVMVMNPDVILRPDHLAVLRDRFEADPAIGAAQGKLYRIPPERFGSDTVGPMDILDSAGHIIRRDRMVIDRGQGERDGPEFSRECSVFSACGAALFLRRSMLEDVAPDGEYFDPTFFAYKEDIDLCWRARILGWDIRYIPEAVGWHVRGWAGGRIRARSKLPLAARRHSWKNHYLLLIKNDGIGDLVRALPFVLAWEVARHAYVLLREPRVYGAYLDLVRLLPSAIRRRRDLFRRRRTHPMDIRRWFGGGPRSPGVDRNPGLERAAGRYATKSQGGESG